MKPAELTEPSGEEQVVTKEVVATEEVVVTKEVVATGEVELEDTSTELDQDLDRLLRFACIHTQMQ